MIFFLVLAHYFSLINRESSLRKVKKRQIDH